eukprot:TRINITY_DN26706_c0_g1_i1.p1 TRINITY_DN26706_c0_g1~~TRINITY_DN26706_c0_g1_i1.p1  ORF type:complete len:581 (-),score=56.43 TRINITY_DN26706_c0_g1_i1:405-2111(-)
MMLNSRLSRREIVLLFIFALVPVPFAILAIPCAPAEANYAFRATCLLFTAGSCVALLCEKAQGIALSIAMFANETAGGIVVLFWCGPEWARNGLICVETAFVFTSLRLFFTSIWHFWHFLYVICAMGVASHISHTSAPILAGAASQDDRYEDWSVTLIVLVACLIGGMCAIGYLDPHSIATLIRRRPMRSTSNLEEFEVDRHGKAGAFDNFISITPSDNVLSTQCDLDCPEIVQDMHFLNTMSSEAEPEDAFYIDDAVNKTDKHGKASLSFISEFSLDSGDTLNTVSTMSTIGEAMPSTGVQTGVAWNGNVLKCASCSLPPRRKRAFAGKWVMCPYNKEVPSNLQMLNILEEAFLDKDDESGELEVEGGATYLLNGRISVLANGMLQREIPTEPSPTLSTYMRISEHLDIANVSALHSLNSHDSEEECRQTEPQQTNSDDSIEPSTCDASVQTSCPTHYFCVCNHRHITQLDGWWRAVEYEGEPSMPKKLLNRLQIQGATITDRRGTRRMAHDVHGQLLFPDADGILSRHARGMELIGNTYRVVYKKLDPVKTETSSDSSSSDDSCEK